MNNLKKQNKAKAEFRIHLIIYLVVISILTIINLTITPEYFWAKWPMIGWGIAIIIHAISVYSSLGNSSAEEPTNEK